MFGSDFTNQIGKSPEDKEFSECYESVNSGLILEYL